VQSLRENWDRFIFGEIDLSQFAFLHYSHPPVLERIRIIAGLLPGE